MKKTWLVSGLVSAGIVGYTLYANKKNDNDFSYRLLKHHMKNSGYRTIRTEDKGVYILEKNNEYALFIYDNESFRKEPLFNTLNRYQHMVNGQFFLLSESTNLLFGKTKPLFMRWNSLYAKKDVPTIVHFSTIKSFKIQEEIPWETNYLHTHR